METFININGAGFHDYEDVPRNLYEEESNININDDLLCESKSVVSGGHDHLPRKRSLCYVQHRSTPNI